MLLNDHLYKINGFKWFKSLLKFISGVVYFTRVCINTRNLKYLISRYYYNTYVFRIIGYTNASCAISSVINWWFYARFNSIIYYYTRSSDTLCWPPIHFMPIYSRHQRLAHKHRYTHHMIRHTHNILMYYEYTNKYNINIYIGCTKFYFTVLQLFQYAK